MIFIILFVLVFFSISHFLISLYSCYKRYYLRSVSRENTGWFSGEKTQVKAMNLVASQLSLSREHERQSMIGWVKELQKSKNIFCLRSRHVIKRSWLLSSLFYYSLQAGCMKKRDRKVKLGSLWESHWKSWLTFQPY